jgi:hypothetical protein
MAAAVLPVSTVFHAVLGRFGIGRRVCFPSYPFSNALKVYRSDLIEYPLLHRIVSSSSLQQYVTEPRNIRINHYVLLCWNWQSYIAAGTQPGVMVANALGSTVDQMTT